MLPAERSIVFFERRNMKIATLIARILLGLIFLVFGLNQFLHFIPVILPSGLAGQFLNVLIQSHYILFIGALLAPFRLPAAYSCL
jgi:uncharacterized membrane protein YphA (DoxX/SURF4 family)